MLIFHFSLHFPICPLALWSHHMILISSFLGTLLSILYVTQSSFFHSRSDSGLFLLSCRLWMNIRPYPLAPLSSALPPFIALLGPASFFLLNISSTLFQISYFLGLSRAYVCAFQECLILSYLISPPSFFPSPSVILFLPLSSMTCIPALFISVIYLLSCRHIASQK